MLVLGVTMDVFRFLGFGNKLTGQAEVKLLDERLITVNYERRTYFLRTCLFFIATSLVPSLAWSNEYALIVDNNAQVCQQMLKLYNSDVNKYGYIKYNQHEEFNWPQWEEKTIQLRPPGAPTVAEDIDVKIAMFDINNDSKYEAVVFSKGSVGSVPTDNFEVFRMQDLQLLDSVIDGNVFYSKALLKLDSSDGVPFKIENINKKDFKKLPGELKKYMEASKARGNDYEVFVDPPQKIHFLKLTGKIFVSFEEFSNDEYLSQIRESVGFNKGVRINKKTQYNIISKFNTDNTVDLQCLYFRNNKSTTRRSN
jgi:hypothetical protein